jgi:hypothetical protein
MKPKNESAAIQQACQRYRNNIGAERNNNEKIKHLNERFMELPFITLSSSSFGFFSLFFRKKNCNFIILVISFSQYFLFLPSLIYRNFH